MPGPRGTRNGASKLTEKTVREIREQYRPFKNASQLARRYGVTRNTIRAVADGEIWGWLE